MRKTTIISGIIFILLALYQLGFYFYLKNTHYNSGSFLDVMFGSNLNLTFLFWLIAPISAITSFITFKDKELEENPIKSFQFIKKVTHKDLLFITMVVLLFLYFYSVFLTIGMALDSFGKAFR